MYTISETMLHLSANIRLIRVLAGKTQDEFADLLGEPATKDMIYTYERGMVKKPNKIILQRISNIASITLDQLMNKPLSEEEVNVIDPETKQMEFKLTSNVKSSEVLAELKEVIKQKEKTIADQQLLIERLMTLLSLDNK